MLYKLLLDFIILLIKFKSILYQLLRIAVIRLGIAIPLDKISQSWKINETLDGVKAPNHISFNITENDISIEDIAKLIIWSSTLGISIITIITSENTNNFLLSFLPNYFNKQKGIRVTKDINELEIKLDYDKKSKINLVNYNQGCVDLTSAVNDALRRQDEISEENIQKLLKDPQIDYTIYFGNNHHFTGFDPWRNKSSEFKNIDTHHGLGKSDFLDIFRDFSKRQQRWGL